MSYLEGRWVCDKSECPKYKAHAPLGPPEEPSYCVEKRFLNIANIMFLSSSQNDKDPDEFAEDFAARLQELTEEIVNFELEVYPLNGGYIGHAIEGTELVPKRISKQTFRKRIFQYWQSLCAYCGEHADTLDHVIPRHKGGLTTKNNLISCCRRCNGSKGAENIWEWYNKQPFFNQTRADAISDWISNE